MAHASALRPVAWPGPWGTATSRCFTLTEFRVVVAIVARNTNRGWL